MTEHRRSSDPRKPLLTDEEEDAFDSDTEEDEEKTGPFLYFVVCVACLGPCMLGVGCVWISSVAPKITSYNSTLNPLGYPVTTVELSLTGSLIQIGGVLGAVLLKNTFDQFGRKRSLARIHFLLILAFAALAFSKNIVLYFIFLFIIGLLIGGINVGSSIYISEVTQDYNRANLSCLMGLFIQIGNLYGYIVGSYVSIESFSILCGLPSLLFFVISDLFLPESPAFLIIKNRKAEAQKALQQLIRCDNRKAKILTDNIEFTINHTSENSKSSFKSIWLNKSSRKAMLTTLLLMFLTCVGLPAVMSYLSTVFQEADFTLSSSVSTIIVGVFQVICFVISSFILSRVGMRSLVLASILLSCIPWFVVGLFFYLKLYHPHLVVDIKWLPFAGMMVLIFLVDVGIVSVAYAYSNQVFASDIKATAFSIMYFSNGVISAVTVFLFPIIKSAIGLEWVFWISAIIFFVGFVVVFVTVPEIRGKNIIEIQKIFTDSRPPFVGHRR